MTKPNKGLIISGAVVFGTAYGLSATVATFSAEDRDLVLYLPIAGPLIRYATKPSCNSYDCDSDKVARRTLILDFGLQTLGAALFVSGFMWPGHVFKRDDAFTAQTKPVEKPNWAVVPLVGSNSSGLAAIGQF